MRNGIRVLTFGALAAALVMFAAFNSRAKAPRANASFPRPALDQPVAATKGKANPAQVNAILKKKLGT